MEVAKPLLQLPLKVVKESDCNCVRSKWYKQCCNRLSLASGLAKGANLRCLSRGLKLKIMKNHKNWQGKPAKYQASVLLLSQQPSQPLDRIIDQLLANFHIGKEAPEAMWQALVHIQLRLSTVLFP